MTDIETIAEYVGIDVGIPKEKKRWSQPDPEKNSHVHNSRKKKTDIIFSLLQDHSDASLHCAVERNR